jgi:uncharacterized membrane protein
MDINAFELIAIVLTGVVTGVFFGPWLGLSRSIDQFSRETFLAIGKRMIGNLRPVMPVLMPLAILSVIAAAVMLHSTSICGFWLTVAGLALFLGALLITLTVEVPIDNQIRRWTLETMPAEWEQIRDRWERFHALRTFASLGAFVLVTAGAIFR